MTQPDNSKRQLDFDNPYVLRHVRFGWWLLLVFLLLGIVLEALHGLKIRWYLDVSHETRRLMWTLGHAHGVLLGLVNIALAVTWAVFPGSATARQPVISKCMLVAGTLLPGGFLLGGFFIYQGDPGMGICLVPLGALALCVGVFLTVISLPKRPAAADGSTKTKQKKQKKQS